MPTRNGSSSGNSLQSDLRYGTSISAQVETGIDNAHKQRKNASDYAKTLSDSDLAKAYSATSREYDRMSGGADEFDKENPEAGNFGSADSYVRMGADSYHDTYYVPIRDELTRRWLNTDGKPFWLESYEDKKNANISVKYESWEKLEYFMNYAVSPSASTMGIRNYSRESGKNADFSGVSDEIISKSVKLAEQGLSEIRKEAIQRDKEVGGKYEENKYYETKYPAAYKENILDPLVNELNKRKNK